MTTINKTFKDLYPTYTEWQNLVEKPAFSMFPSDSEIIAVASQFVPLNQLYVAIKNQYYSRGCRYNDEEQSMRLSNTFADAFTSFWFKTRPFIKNQLRDLEEIKERGDNEYYDDKIADSVKGAIATNVKATDTADTASSTQPFNSDGIPLASGDNISHKTGQIGNQTKESSGTTTSDRTRTTDRNLNKYNIIEDIMRVVEARLSLELTPFVGMFNDLFTVINAIPLTNTWNFTQNWNSELLGALWKDLKVIFKQGPNMIVDFDITNGIPTITFSTPTIKRDIAYEPAGIGWEQTTIFQTKADPSGSSWVICGMKLGNGVDNIVACPPENYYQDANYNNIIKARPGYTVTLYQDEARTQVFGSTDFDFNPEILETFGSITEVDEFSHNSDWFLTPVIKYKDSYYHIIWKMGVNTAQLQPGINWKRITIASSSPFTEITGLRIKEVK